MNKEKIEVIIPCGQNSDKFVAKYMKSALETCSGEYDLTFSLGLNNFPQFEYSHVEFVNQHAELKIKSVDTETEPGSVGHALVLQSLYDDVDADYCLIADCDVMMLRKNWDQIMVSKLTDKTVICGTDYFKDSNLPKYVNFPALIVAMFRHNLMKKHNISFMPHPDKGAHEIVTKEQALSYGRPKGSRIYLDVGYEFPMKLRPYGLDGFCFNFTKPTRLGTGQEFHYENEPFLTHMKGSSVKPADDPFAQFWLYQADRWNTLTMQKNKIIT
jgi:hypothetical protein